MRKLLIILAVCISGYLSVFAQSDGAKVIKPMEATSADYISLLNNSGYEAFPFDVTSLSDGKYHITFKIKEYKDGKIIRDDIFGYPCTFVNMHFVSEFPEEDQENIKPEEMADPERGIFAMAGKITVGFTPSVNDSIRPLLLEVENMGARSMSLQMMPQYQNNDSINGEKFYMYFPKPFKVGEFTIGQFIPLVLYGSGWYDKNFGIHRFCGENEIDPDMSSRILRYIPHYYIIGIEVNPVKKLLTHDS